MALHPEVLWAQRSSATQEEKNIVYITVNLPDILEDTLKYDLSTTSISFGAKSKKDSESEPRDYAFKFDFYSEVIPEKSGKKLSGRSFDLVIRKKETKLEYWPRLTKEKAKTAFIKTDFNKWIDEDEQDGVQEDANDDFDMGGLGGMGGMGGMGGLGGLGGMGGMGGMGGDMDFDKMMADFGKSGSSTDTSPPTLPDDSEDSDDEGPPPLESVASNQ